MMKFMLAWGVSVLMALASNMALAQENVTLTVKVMDASGKPVKNVAVSADPKNLDKSNVVRDVGTMDQINRQFAPHLLVVQKGAKVRFPNSDSIKHHVYSFSSAKRFELLLNKGMEEDPLLFEKAGIVELGCNVHDWMLGYIYVVDTPYFDQTNEKGEVTLVLPPDQFIVKAWHPRMQETPEIPSKEVDAVNDQVIEFTLTKELLPSFEEYQSSDEFGDYD